jgi:hypothetical protein
MAARPKSETPIAIPVICFCVRPAAECEEAVAEAPVCVDEMAANVLDAVDKDFEDVVVAVERGSLDDVLLTVKDVREDEEVWEVEDVCDEVWEGVSEVEEVLEIREARSGAREKERENVLWDRVEGVGLEEGEEAERVEILVVARDEEAEEEREEAREEACVACEEVCETVLKEVLNALEGVRLEELFVPVDEDFLEEVLEAVLVEETVVDAVFVVLWLVPVVSEVDVALDAADEGDDVEAIVLVARVKVPYPLGNV